MRFQCLVRAIGDIARTVQQKDIRESLLRRAGLVVDGAVLRLGQADADRLRQRLADLRDRVGG